MKFESKRETNDAPLGSRPNQDRNAFSASFICIVAYVSVRNRESSYV